MARYTCRQSGPLPSNVSHNMPSPPKLDLKIYHKMALFKSQYARYNYGVDDVRHEAQ